MSAHAQGRPATGRAEDIEAVRDYCAEKPGTTVEYPFGPGTRVFKVMGKIFALVPDGGPSRISVKCDPVLAEILRSSYTAVQPGYHLSKRHWNTVTLDGSVGEAEVAEMIDHSYLLVVNGLPKALRERLPAS